MDGRHQCRLAVAFLRRFLAFWTLARRGRRREVMATRFSPTVLIENSPLAEPSSYPWFLALFRVNFGFERVLSGRPGESPLEGKLASMVSRRCAGQPRSDSNRRLLPQTGCRFGLLLPTNDLMSFWQPSPLVMGAILSLAVAVRRPTRCAAGRRQQHAETFGDPTQDTFLSLGGQILELLEDRLCCLKMVWRSHRTSHATSRSRKSGIHPNSALRIWPSSPRNDLSVGLTSRRRATPWTLRLLERLPAHEGFPGQSTGVPISRATTLDSGSSPGPSATTASAGTWRRALVDPSRPHGRLLRGPGCGGHSSSRRLHIFRRPGLLPAGHSRGRSSGT